MPFNPEANQEAEDANIAILRELEQQLLWQISDAEKMGASDEVRDLQARLAEVREEIKQRKENKQSVTETDSEENSEKIAQRELKNMRGIIGMDNTDNDHS